MNWLERAMIYPMKEQRDHKSVKHGAMDWMHATSTGSRDVRATRQTASEMGFSAAC